MTYEPTNEDLHWAATMMAVLNNGALLVYPNCGLVYRVEHTNKVLTLENPILLLNKKILKIHKKTIATFQHIGYSVTIKHDA